MLIMISCIRIKVRQFFFCSFLSEVIHSSMIYNYLDLYVIYSELCDTVIIWILWIKHAMDWKEGDDTRACVHVHSTQFTSFLLISTQQVLNAHSHAFFIHFTFTEALFSINKEKKEQSRVQGPCSVFTVNPRINHDKRMVFRIVLFNYESLLNEFFSQ